MHIDPYLLFVSAPRAELVQLHDTPHVFQLLVWEDASRSKVIDIQEGAVEIDWSTIPTNLRTAHRRVVNMLLDGEPLARKVSDFFKGLQDAAHLKTAKTVEDYEEALLAGRRMGKIARGDLTLDHLIVTYEDRYGEVLKPPVEQPSLAESLAAVEESEPATEAAAEEPKLGDFDPAVQFAAEQAAFDRKLVEAIREPEPEPEPKDVAGRLRDLEQQLLTLPKGTPYRTKREGALRRQMRKLRKKLPMQDGKLDPMVADLSARLEKLLTPATA